MRAHERLHAVRPVLAIVFGAEHRAGQQNIVGIVLVLGQNSERLRKDSEFARGNFAGNVVIVQQYVAVESEQFLGVATFSQPKGLDNLPDVRLRRDIGRLIARREELCLFVRRIAIRQRTEFQDVNAKEADGDRFHLILI